MLVLTRKLNETIHFPELDISVNVLSLGNSKVRIGIDAPLEIKVIRGELARHKNCLLYTSPSPRDRQKSRMPSSA